LKSFARFKRLAIEQDKNPQLKQALENLRMREQAEESRKPIETHAEVYAAGFNAGYVAKAKEDKRALAQAIPTLLSDGPPGLGPDTQPLDDGFEVNYAALGGCLPADQQAQLQDFGAIQVQDFAHKPSVCETGILDQSQALWGHLPDCAYNPSVHGTGIPDQLQAMRDCPWTVHTSVRNQHPVPVAGHMALSSSGANGDGATVILHKIHGDNVFHALRCPGGSSFTGEERFGFHMDC